MKIRIRAFDPGDMDDVLEIHRQPQCIAQTLQTPYRSPAAFRERWATTPKGMSRLVAEVEQDGCTRVVGLLALRVGVARRAHVGEIGMSVHDAWHRKGIGKRLLEAAIDLGENWLGLQRLELQVYTDNTAAVRLYEGSGFAIEGTLSRFALRNGEYVDAYAMARVRPQGGSV